MKKVICLAMIFGSMCFDVESMGTALIATANRAAKRLSDPGKNTSVNMEILASIPQIMKAIPASAETAICEQSALGYFTDNWENMSVEELLSQVDSENPKINQELLNAYAGETAGIFKNGS